jgi:putative peptidoglycan lipid II flippase
VTLVPLFRSIGVEPITALSVGMLGGGLAQIASQWPSLHREGYRHQWILNPRDPVLREVLVLMGPGTIGVAAAQINLLVNTWLATSEQGAPAALRFAFQLMYLPIGIFGVSVATASIPDLARQAADAAHGAMVTTVSWAIRLMIVLSVPAIVGLVVLAGPIVELIYQRGLFDAESTLMTAGALAFYAPGILGYSIVKIVSPSFYSLREADACSGQPLDCHQLGVEPVAELDLRFKGQRRRGDRGKRQRGIAALPAVAPAGRRRLRACVPDVWQDDRGGRGDGRGGLLRAGLAAPSLRPILWHRLIRVAGAIGVALGVLAAMAHLLRLEEFRVAMARVLQRLRGRSASMK